MHVLIVGCGYVGLRAAQEWLRRGETVSALTRSPVRAAEWAALGINPAVGDVLDPDALRQLPAADLCLYAVGLDRSSGHDQRTVYVDGLRNVLDETRSRIPRLIYLSSTSVYGQDAGEWVNEDSPCRPERENGRVCLDAEQLVREFADLADAPFAAQILRLAGIYGPGRLIGRVDQLRNRTRLTGNPDAWLNLVHVNDLVSAILRLGEGEPRNSLHLLSDCRPVRRREFYETLAGLAGTPAPVFRSDEDRALNKRCDSSRIREELGFAFRFPTIVEGLESVLGEQGSGAPTGAA